MNRHDAPGLVSSFQHSGLLAAQSTTAKLLNSIYATTYTACYTADRRNTRARLAYGRQQTTRKAIEPAMTAILPAQTAGLIIAKIRT
jgi:hypothetical protein